MMESLHLMITVLIFITMCGNIVTPILKILQVGWFGTQQLPESNKLVVHATAHAVMDCMGKQYTGECSCCPMSRYNEYIVVTLQYKI